MRPSELVAYPFVTTSDAIESAAWPPEHARTIALELANLPAAVEACIASLGLALLPKAAARSAMADRRLRCLDASSFRTVRLFALRRPQLCADHSARLIDALTAHLRELDGVRPLGVAVRAAAPGER